MQETVETAKKMMDVFGRCSLLLENEEISREHILKSYIAFLDENMLCDHHKTIAVLSAENRVFDAVTIACAALSCILSDDVNPESIVSQLDCGSRVEYKNSRYIFNGFSDQYGPNYVVLIKDNGEQKTVGRSNWSKIVPYYGKAESLDGRGIKKKDSLRTLFFTEILGVAITDVPSIMRTSVIVIMSPEDARYYLDNISFSFGGHNLPLLDLVTASYYTENNVIRFRGNSSDNDPVLKVTNKAANARSLIYEDTENDNIGVIVLGQDVYRKNDTELTSLVTRRKLRYSLLSMKTDDACGPNVVDQYEEVELFVCTRDFLLSTPLDMVVENRFTIHLHKAMDHIVDHEITKVIAESEFPDSDYYSFKALMTVICRQAKENRNDKDNLFIRQAYSLMKLMITAPFSMEKLEKENGKQIISIPSAGEKLGKIKSIALDTSPFIREKTGEIIKILETAYISFRHHSGKESCLTDLIRKNRDKRIAIVVPYEYYSSVIRNMGLFRYMKHPSYLNISTPAGFNYHKEYDILIVTALLSGESFDVFRNHSAYETHVIIYPFEERLFKSKKRYAAQIEKHLNEKASFEIEMDEPVIASDPEETLETLNSEDLFVEDFVNRINAVAYFSGSMAGDDGRISGMGTKIVTVRSAVFEDEEIAFFTKNYKAYVLNTIEETVSEKPVENLSVGDTLIFTRSNEKTRDIVDVILQKIIENEKVSDEVKLSYQRSIRWKEDLRRYKEQNRYSTTIVIKALLKENVGVSDVAIRNWLDQDSHIVRPRAASSLLSIARVTGDTDLENQLDLYVKACDDIYRLRGNILKEIGKAIIGRITGKGSASGSFMSEIYERLDTAGQILRIETISDIQQEVPANFTNRPFFQ